MEVFGIDLTLPLFLMGSFLGLCGIEYLLCRKVKWKWVRLTPWGFVIFLLVTAVGSLLGDTGGWIDLRSFFALVFAVYAVICGSGILLGWYLAKKKNK